MGFFSRVKQFTKDISIPDEKKKSEIEQKQMNSYESTPTGEEKKNEFESAVKEKQGLPAGARTYKKGGKVAKVRGHGIESRGKTKGKFI